MDKMKINEDQQFGLLKAMNITMKDLDLNRSGVLSDKQRRTLRWNQIGGALGWWFLAFMGALPMIFPNHWRLDRPNLLLNVGAIVVGVGMAFWRQYQLNQALKENKVADVTGSIKKTCRTENRHKVYRANVDEKKFQISQSAYDCLLEGDSYSFYYVPQTGELMSIGRPLTDEEKIRFSFTREHDLEKEKRFVEPDIRTSDATTIEDNTPRAHLSGDK